MTKELRNKRLRSGRLRRFLSLKWKTLLLFSLVLVFINASFPFLNYMHLLRQFDTHRETKHKQYAREFEKVLHQTAQGLQQFGTIIPSLNGMEKAFLIGEQAPVVTAFDKHWPLLQLETGIDTVRFYTTFNQILATWGTSNLHADDDPLIEKWIEEVLLKNEPVMALSCDKECTQYVMTPLLMNGQHIGALLLGSSLSNIIENFQQISGVDMGVVIKRSSDETPLGNEPTFIPSWNTHVVALTNMNKTLPLLREIAQKIPLIDTAKKGRSTSFDSSKFDIRLIPLQGLVDSKSGHLVIIDDISEPLSEIRMATKQSVIAGLLGLLFSEGFLLLILSNPMSRMERIAETLPLLAQSAFRTVRSAVSKQKKGWIDDEIDPLGDTAVSLSYQLEKLENEVKKRTRTIADKMEDLATEKAFISNLLDTARVIILTQNNAGKIMTLNQYGSHLTGYTPHELEGKKFLSLLSSDNLCSDLSKELTNLAIDKREHLSHESVVICKDLSTRHIVWAHSSLARKGKNEPAILSVGLDFTERKRAELRLSWLADHDSLTGLFNRRRFQREIGRLLAESKRYNRSGALLVFDLDQFKYVNDTRGHHAGDELLKVVADQLSRLIRSTDFVSRLGGDEFALVISEASESGAVQVAEKIIEYLKNVEIPTHENRYKVSASIGIALFPKHGTTVQRLLSNADLAMVQAKDRERGSWHIFSGQEPIKKRMQKRAYWEDKIKQALDKDDFVIHFQPVQNVSNGSIYFHEALLRMHHEDRTLIPPGSFIPIAETSGLIFPIDHMVLNKVISCQALLARKGVHATFAINISGHAFNDKEFLPHLQKTLHRTGADPKSIILEITETAAVSDLVAACNLIQEIKALGCRFALDDFGMGFSSFNYMKQLPVDFVKIGDTFIKELSTHTDDQIFVKSLSEVTRGLGKKTVAEGVENAETLALLQEYSVDFAQGFHLGKPTPIVV